MSRVAIHAEASSAAPPDVLFAVLVDWPRHAEWMPFTRAEGGHGVGADLAGWTGVGPVGFLDTMVITGWRPGRRVAVRHTGRVVRGEAYFAVEPLAGGSRIVWAEAVDLPLGPLGRAGWIVAGPVVKAFMGLGLRRLAALAARDVGPVR
ncbi:SRPBCC family protein [Actinomadura parmotrematis]|uniref:SRPBCC family protein n=1 Tax=Actinomadura parmotrematis TaxID=2864039 RepID=A0ABS7FP71_9ACTN|nr:SRPBCC family protein [Actinomadura parmotrematis]MBW8481373.1 SRPBCC family protein [Actinomadura parmotrematis]